MPLPNAKPIEVAPGLTVHEPLSRLGYGPGLIIMRSSVHPSDANTVPTLDPEPIQKWAEEGYTVAEIGLSENTSVKDLLNRALDALSENEKCTKKLNYGLIVYPHLLISDLTKLIDETDAIKVVVSYGTLPQPPKKPHLYHLAEPGVKQTADNEVIYRYPEVQSCSFILPSHKHFSPSSTTVAHTRCLEFLKKRMDGPWFDLEEIWDEHTRFEFETRSVEDTMDTMVAEPYVNHIPTLTGGIGREKLSHFYANHFIFNNPDDTALELVSRTVGIDRVVDEFIMNFTHDRMVDWLIPGIPPTGKKLRIPFIAVVNIRGDRLYHEHITWDQLTVLFQLGLMPEYIAIPIPSPEVAGGSQSGSRLEYRVPGAGVETAEKMVDESSVPSNEMFNFSVREIVENVERPPM